MSIKKKKITGHRRKKKGKLKHQDIPPLNISQRGRCLFSIYRANKLRLLYTEADITFFFFINLPFQLMLISKKDL